MENFNVNNHKNTMTKKVILHGLNILQLVKKILSSLDTLETKEVDLEKEIDTWYQNKASKEFENVLYKDIEKCAEHFFELGMSVSNKVQKEDSMTKEEAIKYLQQLYSNGGHCWLDEQRIEAIGMAVKALQEEPVSKDLEEASKEWLRPQLDKSYANYGEAKMMELTRFDGYAMLDAIEFGAKWKKEQMMKDAIEIEGGEFHLNFANAIISKGTAPFEKCKVKMIIIKEN